MAKHPIGSCHPRFLLLLRCNFFRKKLADMAKKATSARTHANQFADLNEAPKVMCFPCQVGSRKTNRDADFDPEDANGYQSDSEGEDQDEREDEARAHYETVGYGRCTIAGIIVF